MLKNLEEPLPIEMVSKEVCLSVRQIERIFKRYLSTSPQEFYRSKRLEQAKILLEDTNMSVTEIGHACGFTPSVFARNFRKLYNITPTMYRKGVSPISCEEVSDNSHRNNGGKLNNKSFFKSVNRTNGT